MLYQEYEKYAGLGIYNEAIYYLFEIVSRSGYDKKISVAIANLYYMAGEFEYAIAWLKDLIAKTNEDAAMLLLAEIYAVADDVYEQRHWLEYLERFLVCCKGSFPSKLLPQFQELLHYMLTDLNFKGTKEVFAMKYPYLLGYVKKNKNQIIGRLVMVRDSIVTLFLDEPMDTFKGNHYILFGSGQDGTYMYDYLTERGGDICFFIDNDKSKNGKCIHSIPVKLPAELKERNEDCIIIISSSKYRASMETQLSQMGLIQGKDYSYFEDYRKTYIDSLL